MVNNSVIENESGISMTDSSIVDPNIAGSAALAVSNISLSMNWSFLLEKKSSLGLFIVAPVIVATATSFFMSGLRYRRFLYSMSSGFNYSQGGIIFNIQPRMRYFVGGSLSSGLLIYNTDSSKKTDLSFNLGLESGMMYQWNKKYSIEASLAMVKRTGVITSGMGMNIFLGMGIAI